MLPEFTLVFHPSPSILPFRNRRIVGGRARKRPSRCRRDHSLDRRRGKHGHRNAGCSERFRFHEFDRVHIGQALPPSAGRAARMHRRLAGGQKKLELQCCRIHHLRTRRVLYSVDAAGPEPQQLGGTICPLSMKISNLLPRTESTTAWWSSSVYMRSKSRKRKQHPFAIDAWTMAQDSEQPPLSMSLIPTLRLRKRTSMPVSGRLCLTPVKASPPSVTTLR